MFGIFKELWLIGNLASGFAKLVENQCGMDLFSKLPNKTKNFMMDKAITTVGEIHGTKIKTGDDLIKHLPDCLVIAFLLLAKEIHRNDSIGHLAVTGGMTSYIKNNKSSISLTVLERAMDYMKDMSIP